MKSNIIPSSVFCLILLFSSGATVLAQDKPEDTISGCESEIEKFRNLWNIPGLAVGIVKDDRIIFEKAFGYRDIENKLPVTPRTQFCIASVSKSFTALAAAILVDEGKLQWDQPIAEYIADFRMTDDYTSLQATLRDLLAHRTGLAESIALFYVFPDDRKALFQRLRYIKPKFGFRARYNYTNIAYVTAGYIVERVTNGSYEQFVSERIFKRLGMGDSSFFAQIRSAPDFALPYAGKENKMLHHVFSESVAPAGGINSSLSDMLQWIRLHLNEGEVDKKPLVSKRSMQEMHKPQVPVDYYPANPIRGINDYGFGWNIETYRNRILLHHGGWISGYVSWISFLPSERIGVVVLSNKETTLPLLLNWWIYDKLLGMGKGEIEKTINESKPKENESLEDRIPCKADTGQDKAILGKYRSNLFGEAAVDYDSSKKSLTINFNGRVTVGLCQHKGSIYRTKSEIPYFHNLLVLFNTNFAGNIQSFEIQFYKDMDNIVFERSPGDVKK